MTKVDTMAAMLLFVALLCACSADYIRERETSGVKNGVVTDLHRFCLENPRDSACQGPASK